MFQDNSNKQCFIEYKDIKGDLQSLRIPKLKTDVTFEAWLVKFSNCDFSKYSLVYDSYNAKLYSKTALVPPTSYSFQLINPEVDHIYCSFRSDIKNERKNTKIFAHYFSDDSEYPEEFNSFKMLKINNFSSDSDSPILKQLLEERQKNSEIYREKLKEVQKVLKSFLQILSLKNKIQIKLSDRIKKLSQVFIERSGDSLSSIISLKFSDIMFQSAALDDFLALTIENTLKRQMEDMLTRFKDESNITLHTKPLRHSFESLEKKLMTLIREKKDNTTSKKVWSDYLNAKMKYHTHRLDLMNMMEYVSCGIPAIWTTKVVICLKALISVNKKKIEENNELKSLIGRAEISANKALEGYRYRDKSYGNLFEKLEEHIKFEQVQNPHEYLNAPDKTNKETNHFMSHTNSPYSEMNANQNTGYFLKEGYLRMKKEGPFKQQYKNYWIAIEPDFSLYRFTIIKGRIFKKRLISLETATTRPKNDDKHVNCFEIISPETSILLQADSKSLMLEWIESCNYAILKSIEKRNTRTDQVSDISLNSNTSHNTDKPVESEQDAEQVKEYISTLLSKNERCADCDSPMADWVSINWGVVVCIKCSGGHRALGTQVSKIRSLTLDKIPLHILNLLVMIRSNAEINEILEENFNGSRPEDFILRKYKNLEFVSSHEEKDLDKIINEESEKESLYNIQELFIYRKKRGNEDLSCYKELIKKCMELDFQSIIVYLTSNGIDL